jgi:cytochrome P450
MKLDEIDLADPDIFLYGDPHSAWKMMREEDPVHWTQKESKRGFWFITRHADALAVYRNPTTFSSAHGISIGFNDGQEQGPAELYGQGKMMLVTDPPRHGKQRMLLNKRFTPRALAPTEHHVRTVCTSIIDSIVDKGECDFVVDVAAKLPTAVICEMMGIPREDWELMYAIANMSVGASDPEYQIEGSVRATGKQAQQEAFNYFVKMIAQRRQDPGSDLVSALVQGEIDGEKLDDIEVLFNCWLLIIAGNETTRNATSGGILALMENPSERVRIKEDNTVMPTAIEEILRWTTPITHLMRTASRDVEFRGRKIRQGDRVVVWNASADRDDEVFQNPDRFDIGRTPNEHIAFGYGEHFCLGANLARLQLKVMVEELTRRLPDIELAGPVQRLRSNLVAGIKHMPVRFTPQLDARSSRV